MTVGCLRNTRTLIVPGERRHLVIQGECHVYSQEESAAAIPLLSKVEAVGFEAYDQNLFSQQPLESLSSVFFVGASLVDGIINIFRRPKGIQLSNEKNDPKNPTLFGYAFCHARKRGGLEVRSDNDRSLINEACESRFQTNEPPQFPLLKHVEPIERGMPPEAFIWAMTGALSVMLSLMSAMSGLTGRCLYEFKAATRSRTLSSLSHFFEMQTNPFIRGFLLGRFVMILPLSFVIGGFTLYTFMGPPRDQILAKGAHRMISNTDYQNNMIVVGASHVNGVACILTEKYGYSQAPNFSLR